MFYTYWFLNVQECW